MNQFLSPVRVSPYNSRACRNSTAGVRLRAIVQSDTAPAMKQHNRAHNAE